MSYRGTEVLARQADLNRATESSWDTYAEHRKHVTSLVVAAISQHHEARVCILGAGNCNDLELIEVEQCASEIWLVDIDGDALERAMARHRSLRPPGDRGSAQITTISGVDLTGIDSLLSASPASRVADISHQAMAGPALNLPKFDVVVSAGLLTQLISLPVYALGRSHPHLASIILGTRTGHLRLLLGLAQPGGHIVLVTDVVSSDTLPALKDAPQDELNQLFRRSLTNRNFFTGANPIAIRESLRTEPGLAESVADFRPDKLWRWDVSSTRSYLVAGMTIRRRM